ncbi:MAG: tetratricopeptide repeat protein [Flavobacteriales bacterium]|nr:tetratricopeptide repeat protein [Flavobacteriales bacterium]
MKKCINILTAILLTLTSIAGPVEQAFERGNELYQQGLYSEAIDSYESGLAARRVSPTLYYNLGNAYYQNGQLARAILSYERALKLGGNDEEALHNLAIAERQRVDEIEPLPRPLLTRFYRSVASAFTPNGWALLGLLAFLISLGGAMSIVLVRGSSGRRPIVVIVALVFLGISILANVIAESEASFRKNNASGIILVANTYVKSGPDADAEDLFVLHEGTKVMVRESYSGWVRVRLVDGKIGWIPEEDVEKI